MTRVTHLPWSEPLSLAVILPPGARRTWARSSRSRTLVIEATVSLSDLSSSGRCAMSAIDRVIVGAAGTTVVGLAGVAGAISDSHMAELARLHGEVGWRSHAFPVSVDGIEVVASLVLLAHRRAGTRAGWLPWAALVAGTAASVAANVAVGASDPVGRLVAGWPAVALLVAIKLLAGLLDARSEYGAHAEDQRGPYGNGC